MTIDTLTPSGDILLIVPPFATTRRPSLGLHILQSCAAQAGYKVSILYSNIIFATICGIKDYEVICNTPSPILVGERIFSNAAYGTPRLGHNKHRLFDICIQLNESGKEDQSEIHAHFVQIKLSKERVEEIEQSVKEWVAELAETIVAFDFKVVGSTSMFQQTSPSIALLNKVKELNPNITTIIGGPNCEKEMAQGIASLSPNIDYIFSGESEETFITFLNQCFSDEPPTERIIHSSPIQNLDAFPAPDFSEYYTQYQYYLPERVNIPGAMELMYETSRGCWWGQKHHCTFCGLNGQVMGFREKSSDKIIHELRTLLAKHPGRSKFIRMSDYIMPYTFFKTLVPELADLANEIPGLRIFYEQKANLSLDQVLALIKAGIDHIQPGIEALSTALLKRMNKGVTAGQNISLLRYARSTGMLLEWNLLHSFPGDKLQNYKDTLALIHLLHHLQPPSAFYQLSIDRFSPYFERPDDYQITNIEPWVSYEDVLPPVDAVQIAYHFNGEYHCDARENIDLLVEISKEVDVWRSKWYNTINLFFGKVKVKEEPVLELTEYNDNQFLLRDTRELSGTQTEYLLDKEFAKATLVAQRYEASPAMEWAIAHKVAVVLDSIYFVPLATAKPDLLLAFEKDTIKLKQYSSEVIPLTAG